MRTGRILLVGPNSFLASRYLRLTPNAEAVHTATHGDALHGPDLSETELIVNFAIDPQYRTAPYDEVLDFDLRLARRLTGRAIRYIMLSTRAVYAEAAACPAREDTPATGIGTYGRNKAETERRLADLLGDRLTVLRIANVIGDEAGLGRRTFMGMALDRLRTQGEIRLDIAPRVRRDFIPVDRFAAALDAVIANPTSCPLNVGSGIATPVGDIAQWLIDGFGTGRITVTDDRIADEFVLDTAKLEATYGLNTTRDDIRAFCTALGQRLKLKQG